MGGINMKECPVIDQVREIRREISEEHNQDTENLIKHYQELEKQTKRRKFRREYIKEKVA